MKKTHWLSQPKTIKKLWIIFTVILITCVAIGFFFDLHPHFSLEKTPGFYAWYGFGTCIGMVVFAKILGIFLKRKEDYYH